MTTQSHRVSLSYFMPTKAQLLVLVAVILFVFAALKVAEFTKVTVFSSVVSTEGTALDRAALDELKAAGVAWVDYRKGILSYRSGMNWTQTAFEGTLDREHFAATTRAYSVNLTGSEPALFMQYQPLEQADRVAVIAAIVKDLERLRVENAAWKARAQEYQQQVAWLNKFVSFF